MRPCAEIDGKLDALRLGPFLEVVKGVFNCVKGDVMLDAKLR